MIIVHNSGDALPSMSLILLLGPDGQCGHILTVMVKHKRKQQGFLKPGLGIDTLSLLRSSDQSKSHGQLQEQRVTSYQQGERHERGRGGGLDVDSAHEAETRR